MSINPVNDTSLTDVENQKPPTPIETTNAIVKRNPAAIVENLMKEWKKNDMYDDDLWDCFREVLENTQITEEEFKKINKMKLRKLRKFLRQRGVWVNRELSMPISRALLEIIAEGTKSTWPEWEMRDRAYAEEFTSPAIRGFLDAEKRRKRAEAASAHSSRSSSYHGKDRHEKEYPRPPSRHGKEYSPTSPVAPYRKVPSISPVQQVQPPQPVQQFQTPPVQQVEPSPVQQLQPPVESAPAPAPASPPIEPAPEPTPAPATAHLTAPKPVLSFSIISEISILPVQP